MPFKRFIFYTQFHARIIPKTKHKLGQIAFNIYVAGRDPIKIWVNSVKVNENQSQFPKSTANDHATTETI